MSHKGNGGHSNDGKDYESEGEHGDESGAIREQDRFLPIANVGRVMKRALPGNAKISKDAKETVQECVSEFISFITGEASDKCQREKRKTINGDDILWAMSTLGFDDYIEPLKIYLMKYREAEAEKALQSREGNPEKIQGNPQSGNLNPNSRPMSSSYYSNDPSNPYASSHG